MVAVRSIPAAVNQVLTDAATGCGASNWVKVEVKDDGAVWQDLTNLESVDWILNYEKNRSVDNQLATATVTLKLRDGELNLSPLMTTSKINATNTVVDVWHQIRISTATMPHMVKPLSGDYYRVFNGYILNIDMSQADTMKLTCGDDGALLDATYIEEVRNYGTAAGRAVETVLQDILTDWPGGVTLQVSAATGATFTTYPQKREPVLNAIRNLAHQIGWDVKYKWWTGAGGPDYELVLFEPDRALSGYGGGATDIDYTKNDFINGPKIVISATDVRNKIKGVYTNSANGSARDDEDVKDDPSIAKYGTRFMEISEDSSSRIDTSAEMTTFLNSALNDLKDPTAIVTGAVPYNAFLELNDVVGLTADDFHFDTNQRLALYAITDSVQNGGHGVSRLTLRGNPTVGVRTHLDKQIVYDEVSSGGRNVNLGSSKTGNTAPNYNLGDLDW